MAVAGPDTIASFADYEATVKRLESHGLAYRCFLSRTELALSPARLSPPSEADMLEAGIPFVWLADARLRLRAVHNDMCFQLKTGSGQQVVAADPDLHGNIVIASKDCPSAYNLAATQDDALQAITHVSASGRNPYAFAILWTGSSICFQHMLSSLVIPN